MMDYMSKGAKPQPLLDRARARLEIQAALKGEQNANDMLPFLAEAGTFGHEIRKSSRHSQSGSQRNS